MKTLSLFTFIILCTLTISVPTFAEVKRLSEPSVSDEFTETFGQPLDENIARHSLAELAVNGDRYMGKEFILETRITKVCQRMGCFFIAQEGKHSIRVSFKDYGFFIPTDSSDKDVMVQGVLVKKQLSQDKAEHLNSDLKDGTDDIEPGFVYEIVASGVKIPKTV